MTIDLKSVPQKYQVFLPILHYADRNGDKMLDRRDDRRFAGKTLDQIVSGGILKRVVERMARKSVRLQKRSRVSQKRLTWAQRRKITNFRRYAIKKLKTAITWVDGPNRTKVPGGFFATGVQMKAGASTIANYRQIFTRDACITIMGALTTKDRTLIKASRASLLTLAAVQAKNGLMPEAAKYDSKGRPKPSDPVGGVIAYDANPLFIIAAAHYFDKTGDVSALKKLFPKIVKAMDFMVSSSKSKLTFNLPDGNNWQDRAHGQYGNVSSIQGMYTEAVESFGKLYAYVKRHQPRLLRSVRGVHLIKSMKAGKFDPKVIVQRQRKFVKKHLFLTPGNYWSYIKRLADNFNKMPAPKIEDSKNPFNITNVLFADRVKFARGKPSGYVISGMRTHNLDPRFDSWSNIVWMLSGHLTKDQSQRIVRHVSGNKIDHPFPIKVIYPSAYGVYYNSYTGRDPQNRPGTYQNGGIWPYQGFYYIAAVNQSGLRSKAIDMFFKYIGHMKKLDRQQKCSMPEWLDIVKGNCGRSKFSAYVLGRKRNYDFGSRVDMAWTSGGALAASYAIAKNKNPFDFRGKLAAQRAGASTQDLFPQVMLAFIKWVYGAFTGTAEI